MNAETNLLPKFTKKESLYDQYNPIHHPCDGYNRAMTDSCTTGPLVMFEIPRPLSNTSADTSPTKIANTMMLVSTSYTIQSNYFLE